VEDTFGQAKPATTFLPMTGNTLEADPGWFSPELMMASRDRNIFNLYGEAHFAGSVEGPLFPSNAIQLLVAAIGTDAVTGTTPDFTHTISQANQLKSLTIEKNVGGFQSLQFAGCRVNKFGIKAPTGNEAMNISADVMGRSVAIMDTPTPVSVTDEMPFVFAEASLVVFGNARNDVQNVELDIENGVKETYTYSGSHGPSFLTPVTLHVSGKVDVVWSSFTNGTYGDFSTMENGTLGAFALTLAHPGGHESVELSCPQVALSKYSNDLKMSDVVLSTMSFEASKDLSDGFSVQAVVINGDSAAY
jgi:hypothetical protein